MDRSGEILQYLCPVAVFARTSAVTLIDDNEVKEVLVIAIVVRLEDFFGILFTRASDEGLINRKKDIRVRWNDASFFLDKLTIDFENILFQRIKSIHRLIDENISIREHENPRSALSNTISRPASLKELVSYLKGNNGFTCPCREREEDTIFAFSDTLHNFGDRDLLVVARLFL